jgi:hypothetical protein
MMQAERTSETSANFNVITRRYIPEDYKLNFQTYSLVLTVILMFFNLNLVGDGRGNFNMKYI